jgi:gamma-glutamyltranspeptidase/glutathione hydrolase
LDLWHLVLAQGEHPVPIVLLAKLTPQSLTCRYRGYKLISAPPPSSGGTTICETLNILEGLWRRSAQSVHLMVEAMRHVYIDPQRIFGRPGLRAQPAGPPSFQGLCRYHPCKIDPDKVTM